MKTIKLCVLLGLGGGLAACGTDRGDESSSQRAALEESGDAGTKSTPTATEVDLNPPSVTAIDYSDAVPGFALTPENSGVRLAGSRNREGSALGEFKDDRARHFAMAWVPDHMRRMVTPSSTEEARASHEERVLELFAQAGLPADQVLRVGTGLTVRASAQKGASEEEVVRELHSYTTRIERVVDGFPVPNSYAVARIDGSGAVVWQAVHWPPIPRSVLDEARSLQDRTRGSENDFLENAGIPLEQAERSEKHVVVLQMGPATPQYTGRVVAVLALRDPETLKVQYIDADGARRLADTSVY